LSPADNAHPLGTVGRWGVTLGGDKHTNYVILTTFRANSSPYVTMRHFGLLCVAFALYSGSLLAQTTFPIQGTLRKTIDRRPVDFANVLLRSPRDSTARSAASAS